MGSTTCRGRRWGASTFGLVSSVVALTGAFAACGGEDRREPAPGEPAERASIEVREARTALETTSWKQVPVPYPLVGGASVVTLDDGSVLVAGGLVSDLKTEQTTNAVYLFRPSSGDWKTLSPMLKHRYRHYAAKLHDGRVLVASGEQSRESSGGYTALLQSEILVPEKLIWVKTGDLLRPTLESTVTVMAHGEVLLVGGSTESKPTANAQAYLPKAEFDGYWTSAPSLPAERIGHAATLLGDGTVLVTGGGSSEPSADVLPLRGAPGLDVHPCSYRAPTTRRRFLPTAACSSLAAQRSSKKAPLPKSLIPKARRIRSRRLR